MKIVKLMGGLGNQMFQYAFGKVIGADAYDLSWFEEVKKHPEATQRTYELNFFNCCPKFLSSKDSLRLQKNNKFLQILGIRTKHSLIQENPVNVYNANLLTLKRGIFEGYFQCAQYYDSVREQLLKEFIPQENISEKNKTILEKIKSTNSISLHVRRGDYLKLKHIHGICDLDYYQRAIEFITSKIKNPHFFLFSDDIPWVEKNLKINFPYTVVDVNHGKDSAWDMWLMKNCQHNIIANSSFSWWGAWLNENPNKIIIAPKKWFADGTVTEIIPQDWERM